MKTKMIKYISWQEIEESLKELGYKTFLDKFRRINPISFLVPMFLSDGSKLSDFAWRVEGDELKISGAGGWSQTYRLQ
jgi:hypothetical protein